MRTFPEVPLFKQEILLRPGVRVILVDSITQVTGDDTGAIVVAASHGGASSAECALAVPLAAVIFNDAGIGKYSAGIAALQMLQARGVPAAAVAHTSARIGDARDMWEHGVLSHVNAAAARRGYAPGQRVTEALAMSAPGDP